MTTIVFSKDRPMQLDAYLASLLYYSDIQQKDIVVLLYDAKNYSYLLEQYPNVKFISEDTHGGFFNTFQSVVNNADDKILFGCDDVVYIREFTTDIIEKCLDQYPNTIGFSLRLGSNIKSWPPGEYSTKIVLWKWAIASDAWNYPWECMASCYHKALVQKIIEKYGDKIKNPNFLESYGFYYVCEHTFDQPYLAMFNSESYAVAQDINRVQDLFPNAIHGDETQTSENLIKLYYEGYRLDWMNLRHITPPDFFVGNTYFKLCKTPS